jgi:hypothetical protein
MRYKDAGGNDLSNETFEVWTSAEGNTIISGF